MLPVLTTLALVLACLLYTSQLFIVLLMGYIVVKAKLLKPSDSKVLSVVFVYLIMPCVVPVSYTHLVHAVNDDY